jgi:hypothetical protein
LFIEFLRNWSIISYRFKWDYKDKDIGDYLVGSTATKVSSENNEFVIEEISIPRSFIINKTVMLLIYPMQLTRVLII